MTRKAKKPAKRTRKPKAKHKVVRGLEEALASAPLKPTDVVEWDRKPGFWKRIWVAVFGE